MSELTGFIPAGGLGSRLRPHTLDTPKPLLLMGAPDRRVIDGPLDASVEACEHTWVSTDYLAEQIHDYLGDRIGVTALQDSMTVGSAGSLFEHYETLSSVSADGDMLVLPSDHVYENFSVTSFWERHKETDADITLLTVAAKPYGEYVVAEGDRALSVERSRKIGALSTTGIFIFRNAYLMNWLSRARKANLDHKECNIYYDIVCPAVGRVAVATYSLCPETGFWEDTGTPERYLNANMRLSGGNNVISPRVSVHPDARIEGCVVLGDGVIDARTALENAIISTRRSRTEVTLVNPKAA